MQAGRKTMHRKGSTPELKGQYLLTSEDDPTTSQDDCCTTLEAIGRHMHWKGDGA